MRASLNRALYVTAFILGLAVTDAAAKVYETFDRTIPFDSGGRFRIENVNGSITVETWDRQEVRIEAEKVADSQESMEDISIEVTGSGSDVSVVTRLPRSNRRHESRQVEYHITLPVDAHVDVQTVNGKVEIYGVHGRVEASTTNGGVELEDIMGETDASTTNGSIQARYSGAADGSHHFSTTNGSVTVDLPPGAGGEIDAKTVNGSISTDFPATVERLSRRHLQGSFGGGGGVFFEVSTVNGSVRIRER